MEQVIDQPVWLTSQWGFDPKTWGCVGFSDSWRRDNFLPFARKRALVAIYVTRQIGPENQRGKVVGIVETTGETGAIEQYISAERQAERQADQATREKWKLAVRVTRAWEIDELEWQNVEVLFPATYSSAVPLLIGGNGVPVDQGETARLERLTVREVPVYGQTNPIDGAIRSFSDALTTSRAVHPSTQPYFVGETDGPKHLYILVLDGGVAGWLNPSEFIPEDGVIAKVGFSRSPHMRRNQIQAAYPDGRFRWRILKPNPVPYEPPYPNAKTAIAGEDAMKARLLSLKAHSLGGEFFLTNEGQLAHAWQAGIRGAKAALKSS